MIGLRRHLLRHRGLAAWLVALALLTKLMVPAGWMIDSSGGTVTVQLCTGTGPATMTIAVPGMDTHGDEAPEPAADPACAFAGLSTASLAATDPVLLAAAIAFIVAAAPHAASSLHRGPAFLRPPTTGPPARP